jgi:hypothetical protein
MAQKRGDLKFEKPENYLRTLDRARTSPIPTRLEKSAQREDYEVCRSTVSLPR